MKFNRDWCQKIAEDIPCPSWRMDECEERNRRCELYRSAQEIFNEALLKAQEELEKVFGDDTWAMEKIVSILGELNEEECEGW